MELTNTSVYFHRKYVTILFPAIFILLVNRFLHHTVWSNARNAVSAVFR